MSKVNESMVLKYIINDLSQTDRRIVEDEYTRDLQVQWWFAKWGGDPRDASSNEVSNESELAAGFAYVPPAPDDRETYEAVDAMFSTESPERSSTPAEGGCDLVRYFRAALAGCHAGPPPQVMLRTQIKSERMLFYHDVLTLAGDDDAPWNVSLQTPYLYWDQAKKCLKIQYDIDAVPSGVVQLSVWHRIDDTSVELLVIKDIQLEETTFYGRKEPLWYKVLPWESILGERASTLEAGSHLVYCVDPAKKQ